MWGDMGYHKGHISDEMFEKPKLLGAKAFARVVKRFIEQFGLTEGDDSIASQAAEIKEAADRIINATGGKR